MKITKLLERDLYQLEEFFKVVISDTAQKEGITIPGFVDEEVEEKMELCRKFFKEDNNISILIAMDGSRIIGTISSSYCNLDIKSVIKDLEEDAVKIGAVYIHPSCQRRGIAKLLLTSMCRILKSKDIKEFYLDSGYKSAQIYWRQQFGEPFFIAKEYWGPEADNMIWKVKV